MSNAAGSLLAALRQTGRFVAHVARHYRLFYPVLALTVLVLLFEYAATSLMIPLSAGSSAAGSRNPAVQAWRHAAQAMGMADNTQTWLWLFCLVMIARLAFGFLQSVATTYLGKQVHRRMGAGIFSQITAHEPLQSLYSRSAGHYITLAGDDTFRCGTIITSLLQCGVALFTTLVALVILLQFSAPLFTGVMAFLALALVSVILLFRRMIRLSAASASASRDLNTSFVEALNGIRSIRALAAERFVGASYAAELGAYVAQLFRIEVIKSSTKALPAILLLAVAAILMRPGATLDMPDATLFAGTIIIVRIFASLGAVVTSGSLLLTDIRAVGDVSDLLDRTASATTGAAHAVTELGGVNEVRLRDVSFSYDPRFRVLDKVNATFERGRCYAVVGPSGTGKSTLADVLLGLVPSSGGSIQLVGGNASGGPGAGRCILVEQHTKLFSGTLRDNLQFGLELPDDRLWNALDHVDLEATVRKLRDGLESAISYQGDNFSGGQRQRIGIARALLRAPDVLIMDEATSALDQATTRLVLRNVRESMRNGILILITHDAQVAAAADVILEFERSDGANVITLRSVGERMA